MHCKNFLNVHKNTGEKMLAKCFSAYGCFVKTIRLIVMITKILSVFWHQGVSFYQAAHETKFHLKYQSDPFAQQHGPSIQAKVLICKKLKMNLRIAPTETSFCKLSRPCKNYLCFQKMEQLFNLMRIMLLTQLTNTPLVGKQELEIIFQLEIIRYQSL